MSGEVNDLELDYKPEKIIFVGNYKNPLWWGKKSDVESELLTEEFYQMLYCWRMHQAGLGLPRSGGWADQDPVIMDSLLAMQEYYKANFSGVQNILKSLYSIKAGIFAGFRLKER